MIRPEGDTTLLSCARILRYNAEVAGAIGEESWAEELNDLADRVVRLNTRILEESK